MKYFIYCDESGETSFSKDSKHQHFSICALTVEESQRNKIKNTIRRKHAKLYRKGWPKDIEIKASLLHGLNFNKKIPLKLKKSITGDQFIKETLKSLKNSCSPRIDFFAVNKDEIVDEEFKHASYGIAYNYFAGKLLIPLIVNCRDSYITLDERSKETHSQMHFNGYLETQVRGYAIENNLNIRLEIEHANSRNNYGLQAVDYFSWSIYRKIEHNDESFFNIFKNLIKTKERWYCK